MKKHYAILKTARDIIKTRWTKGKLGMEGGPRCALGAINESYYKNRTSVIGENSTARELDEKAYNKAVEIVCDLVPNGYNRSIVRFNDDRKTTQSDVVKLFNKAVRKAR